jgi:hypothetical protein
MGRINSLSEAMAATDAWLRGVDVGEPECLSAEFRSADAKAAALIDRITPYGRDAIEGVRKNLAADPCRSTWSVVCLLRDDRYDLGMTMGMVVIDDESGEAELVVLDRTLAKGRLFDD